MCAKSLSAYTQPYSPTTFKLQHILYTHTYEPPERLPPESQIYSSIGGRPVHTWPRNGKMDIQCLKTERIAHGYMECYNEWTDISRWTHSRMASVPFWLWTMDVSSDRAWWLPYRVSCQSPASAGLGSPGDRRSHSGETTRGTSAILVGDG